MCSLVDIEWVIQQTAAKENRNQSIQEAVLAKSLRSDCQLFSGATGLTTEKSMWLLSEMIRFVFFQMSSPNLDLIATCKTCGEMATTSEQFCSKHGTTTAPFVCALSQCGGLSCEGGDCGCLYLFNGKVCCYQHASWAKATHKAFEYYLGDKYSWVFDCGPCSSGNQFVFLALRVASDDDSDSTSHECMAPRIKKIKTIL
jgi:hypothetical protein